MIIELVWYRRLFQLVMGTSAFAIFASFVTLFVLPQFGIVMVISTLVSILSIGLFLGYHYGWCDGYRDYKRISDEDE